MGNLIPDIDHPQSTFSKYIRTLSIFIYNIFGHRGFFHSILFIILFNKLTILYKIDKNIIQLIEIGFYTHLLCDFITPYGILLLWPFKIKFNVSFIYIKDIKILEKILFIFFLILLIIY